MSTNCKILIDNEDVVFSGNTPENLATFTNIVFGLIEQQHRFVESFTVDGGPVHESILPKSLDSFNEITIKTASQRDFFLKLINQQTFFFSNFKEVPEQIFLPILSKPFSEFSSKINDFILQISPLLESLQSFREYAEKYSPPWKNNIIEKQDLVENSIEQFLDLSQKKDIGLLAETTAYSLIPALVGFLHFLETQLKSYFESLKI